MQDEALEAARLYCERGWAVFVLKPRSKHPIGGSRGVYDATTNMATIESLGNRLPEANLAVAMGDGLVVLDVDTRNGGGESLAKLYQEHDEFPETPNCATGGGGRHFYFQAPGGALRANLGDEYPGLDIKAKGGYVVAPPSVHPTGGRYEWRLSPEEVDLAPMPQWLVKLARGRSSKPKVPETIAEGARNHTLTRLAGKFVNAGMSEGELRAALHTANAERCKPPLADYEVDRLVNSAMKWERYPDRRPDIEPPVPTEAPPERPGAPVGVQIMAEARIDFPDLPVEQRCFPLTDMGNGERLIAHHGQDLRYCELWKTWLVWDGARWVKDAGSLVMARADQTVRKIILEGYHEPSDKQRANIGKWAMRSEEIAKRRAMIESAKPLPGVVVTPDDLDADPNLITVQNGTLNLQTGKLLPHDRKHLITKLASVAHDPNAESPLWDTFLRRIMHGDAALIQFLQRATGYSLTGDVGEQCFFLLYGTGANGKSVFVRTVAALLGEYGHEADFATFLLQRDSGPRNDVAALKGARFVSALEAEEGKRLAESLIKSVTGGDKVTARFLYSEHFSFRPQFKLWLAANHRPVIRGTDHAIWRRVRLVPFTVTIPEDEQDRRLPDKLVEELPGILNWALFGAEWWASDGLGTAPGIVQATSDYRDETDPLREFLEECCIIGEQYVTRFSKLYHAYSAWCDANNERPLTRGAFGSRLDEKGFPGARQANYMVRTGLTLGGELGL